MKLRILDNKIRLRLERQEVATIIAGGSVGGATNFPAGERLRYRLATDNEKTSATFREGEIVILLHKPTATIWGLDETKISLDAVLPNAEGGLHLLVEKDFACFEPLDRKPHFSKFGRPKS